MTYSFLLCNHQVLYQNPAWKKELKSRMQIRKSKIKNLKSLTFFDLGFPHGVFWNEDRFRYQIEGLVRAYAWFGGFLESCTYRIL